MKRLVEEAYAKATRLLEENRDKLELLAKTLLEKETMDGRDVEQLLGLQHKHEEDDAATGAKPAAEETTTPEADAAKEEPEKQDK